MLKGLRQKPDDIVNSTNAPPWSLAECSKERPSSITTTRAPAPQRAAQSSCIVTDLPDPDLPRTAPLWLPAAFSKELQQKGGPRRAMSMRCDSWTPRYPPWIGDRLPTNSTSKVGTQIVSDCERG